MQDDVGQPRQAWQTVGDVEVGNQRAGALGAPERALRRIARISLPYSISPLYGLSTIASGASSAAPITRVARRSAVTITNTHDAFRMP